MFTIKKNAMQQIKHSIVLFILHWTTAMNSWKWLWM